MDASGLDVQLAHRFFSADCFNRAWEFIKKADRTVEQTEQMLGLAWASYWHWSQRPDCTANNRSISLWQLARVYFEAGRAEESLRYAQMCYQASQTFEVEPVYRGYAHEALARAFWMTGHWEVVDAHLDRAKEMAAYVEDKEDRDQLLADLAAFPSIPPA